MKEQLIDIITLLNNPINELSISFLEILKENIKNMLANELPGYCEDRFDGEFKNQLVKNIMALTLCDMPGRFVMSSVPSEDRECHMQRLINEIEVIFFQMIDRSQEIH